MISFLRGWSSRPGARAPARGVNVMNSNARCDLGRGFSGLTFDAGAHSGWDVQAQPMLCLENLESPTGHLVRIERATQGIVDPEDLPQNVSLPNTGRAGDVRIVAADRHPRVAQSRSATMDCQRPICGM